MSSKIDGFLARGLSQDLASAAVNAGLTLTAVRGHSRQHLQEVYKFSEGWAVALKVAVDRKPIPSKRLTKLLSNANHTCCVCKGVKSKGHLVHHIVPYEKTQDNSYDNLAVLCPTCHDDAHLGPGLARGISQDQVRAAKATWENQVAFENSRKAAQRFEITSHGIDYVNIRRLQQLCFEVFDCIPKTSSAEALERMGMLSPCGVFTGDDFLHDAGLSTTRHWIELIEQIGQWREFTDITNLEPHFLPALAGGTGLLCHYATGTPVSRPHPGYAETLSLHCALQHADVELLVDTRFLLTQTALGRASRRSLYAIYFVIRTVELRETGAKAHIVATPLLMALPAKMIMLADIPDIDRP